MDREEQIQTESISVTVDAVGSVDVTSGSSPPPSEVAIVEVREDQSPPPLEAAIVEEREDQSPPLLPHNHEEEQDEVPVLAPAVRRVRGEENRMLRCIGEAAVNCGVPILALYAFVFTLMVLGVCRPVTLRFGPGASHLLHPNSLFVDSVMVELQSGTYSGPVLYGFYNKPPLDVISNWSEEHFTSIRPRASKDWAYFLNERSHINVSYNVVSPNSSAILVIAEGNRGFLHSVYYPYPNTSLSRSIIHGNGLIQQYISKSSSYYIAVGNMNAEPVEVKLGISAMAVLYNTTGAHYECRLAQGPCSLGLPFLYGNAAVLTTPLLRKETPDDDWYITLSYRPRWITYCAGMAGAFAVVVLIISFSKYKLARQGGVGAQEGRSERSPLLSQNDDDLLSLGSSYDSLSDREDPEDEFVSIGDVDSNSNRRRCAICFDAPRVCFFLPCGHSLACLACGTRVQATFGVCPICRRKIKKVKKIFVA